MKSTVEQLSAKDRKALALFYDTDAYNALKHFAELEITSLGKDALGQTDITQVHYFRGRAAWASELCKLIRQISKETDKNQDS